MPKRTLAACLSVALGLCLASPARADVAPGPCAPALASLIPQRSAAAPGVHALLSRLLGLEGEDREAVLREQLLSGNIPGFLRHLRPVIFEGQVAGRKVTVTLCVAPDYLAIGSDQEFLRVPLGLPAALLVAERFGFLLPTRRMVDAIYAQAQVHLAPQPLPAGASMRSTGFFQLHDLLVQGQRALWGLGADELTGGHKKDLVLTNRLRAAPGREAIYGWHRGEGAPIQPLSTVHGARYVDYSHGVRLVSGTAWVDGEPRPLAALLEDEALAPMLSDEGAIPQVAALVASLELPQETSAQAPQEAPAASCSSGSPGGSSRGCPPPASASRARRARASGTSPGAQESGRTRTSSL
jgi:hypothetical protein